MRTWSEASSNESQGHPLNRLLLRIGAYAAITPLFRSASVLKKESLVTNDCGSSVKRSRHATTATESDEPNLDRKSTRLNSSHLVISYAVFCLKKKKKID